MTLLHEDHDAFRQLILAASADTGITPSIIEKDYYVTLFLRLLSKSAPDVVFKGGTSLSKGYGIIERFSEDIDLNYDNHEAKPSVSMRRKLRDAVLSAGDALGLSYEGPDRSKIPYRQDYLIYHFAYTAMFQEAGLRPELLVETSVRSPSFPLTRCRIGSEIQKFLEKRNASIYLEELCLEPFEMKVQSLKRTFADKLYAAADYYLDDMADRDSRHLYDIYCMRTQIPLDVDFLRFLDEVKQVRKNQPNNPSAKSSRPVFAILEEAMRTDFYKSDYNKYTIPLLFKPVPYETVKETIVSIVSALQELENSLY